MNLFDVLLSSKMRGATGGAISAIGVVGVCADETYSGAYTAVGSMVIE